MSQAATTVRPKPKPRPKPLPKAVSSSVSGSSSAPGPSSITKITYDNVKDNDEMFMRNRGRGKDGWAKLRRIGKETDQTEKETPIVVDGDSDGSTHKPSNFKRKREYNSPPKVPRWQTDKEFARLLSQGLSDGDTDSDDEPVTIYDNGNVHDHKLKRKRTDNSTKRSRSKSITPPPAIPQYQLDHAREAVRKTLGGDRQSSPEVDVTFEEEDLFIYDPQLAKIAQNVKSQSELIGHTSSSVEPNGANDTVDITVRWEPHPLNEHGKCETWGFMLNRIDNFSELFESVAEEANVLVDKVVMTCRGNRFFSSITPQTLNIWSNAEFVACDLPTYEYKRKIAAEQLHQEAKTAMKLSLPARPKDSESNVLELDSDSDSDSDDRAEHPFLSHNNHAHSPRLDAGHRAASSTETPTATAGEDEDQDKFKIVLRSALTSKDITLNVRSTTKCGAIVKAYLNKAGIADRYTACFDGSSPPKKTKSRKSLGGATSSKKVPKLNIDGDKVGNDTNIGDYDLEDGDMVEVVDL
ncbi:hypothetical protein DFH05DRAFT_1479865 [Lentinula detonsa]|uniref:Rad60/SUMO-like domain-containing protein n=1 Tax=Lentinula detonsa TaxID=2804962 RepID=A0A9W8U0F0_9AGAR|nr:hypothetical protein DFH05DRAFT_1479865 [Lentinula detonsa]